MRKFEKVIRLFPVILVLAAAMDFVKQLLLLWTWLQVNNQALAETGYGHAPTGYAASLFNLVLGILLYPLGWFVSAVIITLLIELYDQRRPANSERSE